jgi:predicted nucleotidyltransferase
MIADRQKELRHLAPHEIGALDQFVDRLRKRFDGAIRHVWLFGSKARGDAHAEADIDLLIVVEDDSGHFQNEVDALAVDINLQFDVVLSDHMMSVEQYRRLQAWEEPIYSDIQRDGIDLWALDIRRAT